MRVLNPAKELCPRVGVIGAGQLARMMYAPATSLGLELHLLAEGPETAAAQIFSRVRVGDYTDPAVLAAFAAEVDVITFDHEHVPTAILRRLQATGHLVRPGPDALQYAQDKWLMRRHLSEVLDAPAPLWRVCADAGELAGFGHEIGWPIIAKASRGGYDGHGVWKISGPQECTIPFAEALEVSAGEQVVILAEEFIDFSRELSVLAVRSVDGEVRSYPVSETIQRDGVCRETITPVPGLSPGQQGEIEALGRAIADQIGVVGVLAVEMMQRLDGSVVVNELAMRPHNTGHWTIDGAATSQFENHLRAVAGLPLGSTELRSPVAVMVNILGGDRVDLVGGLAEVTAAYPDLRVELYGKQVRPGRKVGHVNLCGDDVGRCLARARSAAAFLTNRDVDPANC